MKGLILSGGKGTRLRPLTHTSAKQLLPVANKPILFYAIEALVAAGISEIGIVTGVTGDEVRATVGDGSRFGACVTYIAQDQPRGLAHAVLIARSYLGSDSFVMYLGDNLIRKGIIPIVEKFNAITPDALVLLARVPEPENFGVAELRDGKVVRLVEKPATPDSDLALVGVYLFNHTVFEAIETLHYSARGELEITDAIQAMIDSGRRVESHLILEPHEALVATWKDTGRLEDMLDANRFVLEDLPPRIEGTVGEGVQLHGKVIVERGAELRNCTIRGPAIIGERTVIDNAYIGPYTSIYHDCRVHDAEVEYSIVLQNSVIDGVGSRIEFSLIGKDCVIGRSSLRPRGHRLMVGDHSRVELH
jgi:glucose-1-phosphate thymidylyltransferase